MHHTEYGDVSERTLVVTNGEEVGNTPLFHASFSYSTVDQKVRTDYVRVQAIDEFSLSRTSPEDSTEPIIPQEKPPVVLEYTGSNQGMVTLSGAFRERIGPLTYTFPIPANRTQLEPAELDVIVGMHEISREFYANWYILHLLQTGGNPWF